MDESNKRWKQHFLTVKQFLGRDARNVEKLFSTPSSQGEKFELRECYDSDLFLLVITNTESIPSSQCNI
jgi:hypothetical protein